MKMTTTQRLSNKDSRQNTSSSKHSGADHDALSWEGSSIKTRETNSRAIHQSLKSKGSTKTALSDDIRKSISQYDDVPLPSASSVCGASTSQHISSSQSKITAQLLEQDTIWYKLEEEFPIVADYFRETKLNKQLPQILSNIFKLNQLPFSPFSQLMCELRPTMERYQQANVNFSQLSNLNTNKIVLPWAGSVLAKCDNYIWGIPSLLQWIRPQFVLQYDWLVNNLEESFRPVYQLNYEIKPIICLSGATVFVGGLLSQLPVVDIRVEVIITGESEQKAIELFARQTVRDIKSTAIITEHNFHLLIDVPLKDKRWNIDSINSNEDEFRDLIEKTTQDNTSIKAQCVFAIDDDCTSYQFGIKVYTLNFVKSTETNSQVKVFSDSQYKTLYSSVVLGESAGKRYATLFTPGQRPARKLQAVTTRLSINQLEHKNKQDTRPTTINQVEVDKLVELWKKQIAENDGVTSLLLTLHKLILLYCVQRDYDDQLLAQIYNISHSPSYWLLLATSRCGYLIKVVSSKVDKNGNIIKALFSQLKKILSNLFDPLLWEQTSDMKTYHSDLANQINKIDMATITTDNHKELVYLYHYLQGIILGTLKHVLSACPIIKKTIVTIHKSFPEIRKRLGNNSKQLQKTKSKDQLNKKSKPTFRLFRSQQQHNEVLQNSDHDNDDDVTTDDYTDCFIDVDQLQQHSKFPLPVAKEAILLQYAVDCRIDECVQTFLSELLMCVALPRNPYSTLMSLLKQYHWRLCLNQQTDDELKHKLRHNKEQLDMPNGLYRLTNEELFGCAPVLGVVSSAHLMPLITTVLEDYRNHKHTRVKGLLKVKTSVCLTGSPVLYGSVLPYVFDVTVHEHYLITSTMKNHEEQSSQVQLAIALMSEIVTANVTQLIKLHGLICTGVYLGSLSWNVDDFTNKQEEFTIQLHDTLTNKQAIIFKSFYLLDGCYVAVSKHYCMHFITEVGDTTRSYDTFYPASFSSYYTSVFTNRDKALDLYELWFTDDPDPVAPSNMMRLTSELDKHIEEHWNLRKFLDAYRFLLVRSLIKQQWSQVGEAWNMLHSLAGDLEHIQHLCDILQQLALLPPASPPNDNAISTMINKLSIKLQLSLTKAAKLFITEASLLDHIKVILDPYQVSAKLVTGKEASETFSKISVLIMPLMNAVFQDIHALCKENNQLLVSLNIETGRHFHPRTFFDT